MTAIEASVVAERRRLALLFADLCGSTRLVESLEAEDYAALMLSVRRVAEEVIARHGGVLIQMLGDGLVAAFGYPTPREDDARRAASAALELHRRVKSLPENGPSAPGLPLALHSGVHAGLVLLADGDAVRGRLSVHGPAMNIAARLSSAAAVDEILVSEAALGAEAYFFDLGERRTLALAGVHEPVSVRSVRGISTVQTHFDARTRRGLTAFVGRHGERARLRAAVADLSAGRPGAAVIVGAPGIGKTRLAEQILAEAAQQGCDILRGDCEAYLKAEPIQPLRLVLGDLLGVRRGAAPEVSATRVDAAVQALGVDPDLALQAKRLLGLATWDKPAAPSLGWLIALLEAAAHRRPLVIFIDDWQWADDLTRQVLGAVGRIVAPMLILATSRDFGPRDAGVLAGAHLIRLDGLSHVEAEAVVAGLLPGRDPEVMARIRGLGGGNPLFLEELCHSALQRHTAAHRLWNAPASRSDDAAWINGLVGARLARLPADQADLLRMASVVGGVIPTALLHAVAQVDALDATLAALCEADFLQFGPDGETVRFKHGLAHAAIYSSVGLARRRELHAEVAAHLRSQAGDVPHEALAFHYAEAGQAEPAAFHAEVAGDRAAAVSALDRAGLQYRAALAAIDRLPPSAATSRPWMAVALKLAACGVYDPSHEVVAILDRALDLATTLGEAKAEADLRYWLGYINYALGEAGPARGHLEHALQAARSAGNEEWAVRVLATLGQTSASACDYDLALAQLDAALDTRRSPKAAATRSRAFAGLAYTLACKASVLGDRGRFDEADAVFSDAVSIIQGANHEVEGSVLCWMSCVRVWQDRLGEAEAVAAQAQSVAQRVGSLYLLTMSTAIGAYARWRNTGDDAAVATLTDSTAWVSNRGRGLFTSLNFGWAAEMMAARGDWGRTRHFAARTLLRSRKRDRLGEGSACRALARAAAAGEARLKPSQYLDRAFAVAALRGSPHEHAATLRCAAELRART